MTNLVCMSKPEIDCGKGIACTNTPVVIFIKQFFLCEALSVCEETALEL